MWPFTSEEEDEDEHECNCKTNIDTCEECGQAFSVGSLRTVDIIRPYKHRTIGFVHDLKDIFNDTGKTGMHFQYRTVIVCEDCYEGADVIISLQGGANLTKAKRYRCKTKCDQHIDENCEESDSECMYSLAFEEVQG